MTLPVNISVGFNGTPNSRPPLWRVKHDKELGELWRGGMPEVFPLWPNHYSQFTKSWQQASYALNQPWLSPNRWTAVYGDTVWITNDQGFGREGDPRANWVKMEHLDEELPRVEALTCGGNVLTGTPVGSSLLVDMLDWRETPPPLEWLKERPWFLTKAVTVSANGTPRRFPQGLQPNGYVADVVHPFLGDPKRFPITFPLELLQPWTESDLPDPYTLYMV